MRFQIARALDFNQMLVYSVFGHLLVMAIVMFLPKVQMEEDLILPAFVVSLVDLPIGESAKAGKPSLEAETKSPEVRKPPPSAPEQSPAPEKPAPPPAPVVEEKMPPELEAVLAKLEAPKPISKKSKPIFPDEFPALPKAKPEPKKSKAKLENPEKARKKLNLAKEKLERAKQELAKAELKKPPPPEKVVPKKPEVKPVVAPTVDESESIEIPDDPSPPKLKPSSLIKKPVLVKNEPRHQDNTIIEEPVELAKSEPPPADDSRPLLEELDQLARLTPDAPNKSDDGVSDQSLLDKTLQELEALKSKKRTLDEDVAKPIIPDNPLEHFDQLKMKKNLDSSPLVQEQKRKRFKDVYLPVLTAERFTPEKNFDGQNAADLLKEWQELRDKKTGGFENAMLESPQVEARLASAFAATDSRAFEPILQKLGSMDAPSQPIQIAVALGDASPRSFQSGVRRMKGLQFSRVKRKAANGQVSPGFNGTGGEGIFGDHSAYPETSVLAMYIKEVREKVYKRWYEPLAENHDKEVEISFFLFSKGNIDKPFLKKSSGVEQLDSLAIRAILDSEPFPNFPEDLKYSNLHISIKFKYVPEEN